MEKVVDGEDNNVLEKDCHQRRLRPCQSHCLNIVDTALCVFTGKFSLQVIGSSCANCRIFSAFLVAILLFVNNRVHSDGICFIGGRLTAKDRLDLRIQCHC